MVFTCIPGMCLFLANTVFVIIGSVIMGVASVINYNIKESHVLELELGMPNAGKMTLYSGAATFCVAFLGCSGASTRNTIWLSMYKMTLLIIIILQLLFGLSFMSYLETTKAAEFKHRIKDKIQIRFNDYKKGNMEGMNALQRGIRCCGVTDVSDWKNKVPSSCCGKTKEKCNKDEIYKQCCTTKVFELITTSLYVTSLMLLMVPIIEITGLVLACILHCLIKI